MHHTHVYTHFCSRAKIFFFSLHFFALFLPRKSLYVRRYVAGSIINMYTRVYIFHIIQSLHEKRKKSNWRKRQNPSSLSNDSLYLVFFFPANPFYLVRKNSADLQWVSARIYRKREKKRSFLLIKRKGGTLQITRNAVTRTLESTEEIMKHCRLLIYLNNNIYLHTIYIFIYMYI